MNVVCLMVYYEENIKLKENIKQVNFYDATIYLLFILNLMASKETYCYCQELHQVLSKSPKPLSNKDPILH